MTTDELEKKIRLLQAEIAALRINSAGGGADPAELQKIWDELNSLNTDFLALQNQVDGVDTKASNAAALAESAYDNANSAHALAEVAQKDAQTALTKTAMLDANKVGKTPNACQLYGNNNSGKSGDTVFYAYTPRISGETVFIPAYGSGTLKTMDPVENHDCVNKQYVDDKIKKVYRHNIVVFLSNEPMGMLILYSTKANALTPEYLPEGRYPLSPYSDDSVWTCFIERVGINIYWGNVELVSTQPISIRVRSNQEYFSYFSFTDTVIEV